MNLPLDSINRAVLNHANCRGIAQAAMLSRIPTLVIFWLSLVAERGMRLSAAIARPVWSSMPPGGRWARPLFQEMSVHKFLLSDSHEWKIPEKTWSVLCLCPSAPSDPWGPALIQAWLFLVIIGRYLWANSLKTRRQLRRSPSQMPRSSNLTTAVLALTMCHTALCKYLQFAQSAIFWIVLPD